MVRYKKANKNIFVACVANVSVWFRSKERPRNGILGFGRARNETRAKKMSSSRASVDGFRRERLQRFATFDSLSVQRSLEAR